MEIISLPIFFCLFYYIICDLKFVRSFDEDSKGGNHPSGDLKQSGNSEQRTRSDNALKEREANERNCGQSKNNQNNSPNQSQADPSHVTDDPNDKALAEQRAKSEEAVREREANERNCGQSKNNENNAPKQSQQSDPSHVTHTPTTQNPVTPKSNNTSNSKSPKLIDLDIKKKEGTAEFNCSEKGNVVTYTPKAGYGFSTVKEKKGSCSCWGSDKVVWEAENESKHSNKVVIETSSDKQKTLTIHCVDGTKKVYKKVKDGDFVLQNDDSSKDSNPVDSSSVAQTPTPEPRSEEEPTETPRETKDVADPVSQKSEGLELDPTSPTEPPTAEPSSEEEPSEVSEAPESTERGFGNSQDNYRQQTGRRDSSDNRHDRNRENQYQHGHTPEPRDSTRRDHPMTGGQQNYSQSGSHGSSHGRHDGNRERR